LRGNGTLAVNCFACGFIGAFACAFSFGLDLAESSAGLSAGFFDASDFNGCAPTAAVDNGSAASAAAQKRMRKPFRPATSVRPFNPQFCARFDGRGTSYSGRKVDMPQVARQSFRSLITATSRRMPKSVPEPDLRVIVGFASAPR
jgi:hypothetical protein